MSYQFGQSPETQRRVRADLAEAQAKVDRAKAAAAVERTRAMVAETRALEDEARALVEDLRRDRAAREAFLRTLARTSSAEASRRWALLRFEDDPAVGVARLEEAALEAGRYGGHRPGVTAARVREMAAKHREGASLESLMDEYGVTWRTVKRVVSRGQKSHVSGANNPLVGVSPVRDVPRPSQGHAA